ncbi:MAG: hemerythrin domain-containing protein [Lachnospiraceae bacterium]|nr:hemerythrin domain-containing protein [Lachnospiraceae bacterium]
MITKDMINQLKADFENETKRREMSVSEMIEDIKKRHHEKEHIMMDKLLEKIKKYETEKQSINDAKLNGIFGTFRKMAVELGAHFEKEELQVFPRMLTAGDGDSELMLQIGELENEHGKTEAYIADISKASDYFKYRAEDEEIREIYKDMEILFSDISEHEGKENGELFPRFH